VGWAYEEVSRWCWGGGKDCAGELETGVQRVPDQVARGGARTIGWNTCGQAITNLGLKVSPRQSTTPADSVRWLRQLLGLELQRVALSARGGLPPPTVLDTQERRRAYFKGQVFGNDGAQHCKIQPARWFCRHCYLGPKVVTTVQAARCSVIPVSITVFLKSHGPDFLKPSPLLNASFDLSL